MGVLTDIAKVVLYLLLFAVPLTADAILWFAEFRALAERMTKVSTLHADTRITE